MTSQRWQQIKEIFHASLEREPGERRAFLAQACAGDDALRGEVESLIAAHESEGSFIDSPAYEAAAVWLTGAQAPAAVSPSLVGQQVGRYKVLAELGAGGMGEVYLAEDTTLGRRIALKLLPDSFTNDADRLLRFRQEARTASALNHPNIVTIHEIGEQAGRRFIATELIEGQTLRQRVAGGPLDLGEALDIITQATSAVAAAHEAGVVHRDVKPENIMLRPDGYVKVLDFGLAKLTERRFDSIDTKAPTMARVATNPGTVMGTAHYMSPEQARGQEVDARTDIWSLGVVLYEMVAGRVPFDGGTGSDIIVSILDREPPPLTSSSGEVPAELQRIARKALSKDREERYQTVKDLLIDLKSLRQELVFESKREHSIPPAARDSAPAQTGTKTFETTAREAATPTAEHERAATQPGMLTETRSGGRRRRLRWVIVSASLCVVLLGGYLLFNYLFEDAPPHRPIAFLQNMQVTQLTTSGKSRDAVISPDGKYVAYVVEEGGRQSLWMRQVAAASTVQVVAPAEVSYQGIDFSHDGNYIYYNLWDRKGVGEIYQVPVLGGIPSRKIVHDAMPGVAVSPDDKQLAFVRGYAQDDSGALLIANVDGTGEREVVRCKTPDSCWGGSWSPDGKSLALLRWNDSAETSQIYEVPLDGRPQRLITTQRWMGVGAMEWLGDNSGLVLTAQDQRNSPAQIWFISYPEGAGYKVTNDLNGYGNLSLTRDSSTLVTARGNGVANVWLWTGGGREEARQITSGNTDGAMGLAWTPDGRIVYSSIASGNWDLWIMGQDGSGQKQLTFNSGSNRMPHVSPDGRYIVFTSDRTGTDHIWRMNIDGSNQREMTHADGDFAPSVTPDGKWIVYASWRSNRQGMWKVPLEGGEAVQVTEKQAPTPSVSPDGRFIASSYWDDQSEPQQWKVAIFTFPEAEIVRTLATPPTAVTGGGGFPMRWAADGRALTYVDNRGGASNIWSLPVDGSAPKPLTDFKQDRIFSFGWSGDGRQLAVSRGSVNNDVFLIKGFK